MRLLPAGPRALLVEFDTLDDVLAHHLAWGSHELIDEMVPAARTLLLRTRSPAALAESLRSAPVVPPVAGDVGDEVVIPVRYDGEDLDDVAHLTGLTSDEVVAAHTGRSWRVGFGGFAPGFCYLVDGDPRLGVPRRTTPRTRVPAGAVGLAGEFSGVYPRSSPGGWQLIGRTTVALFDVTATPPALLRPGMRVRFEAVDELPPAPAPNPVPTVSSRRRLTIVETRTPILVQDLGRPGHAALGVTRSGAACRDAFLSGERLLGNSGCAALELGFGQAEIHATGTLTLALTGAPRPARAGGRAVGHATVFTLGDGETLHLGSPTTGLRTYLHVRGGVDVAPVLGSRSTDTLAGLGPAPLESGSEVPVGDAPGGWWPGINWIPQPEPQPAVLRFLPGPRADWVAPLAGTRWRASSAMDRVGVRLEGEPLAWLRSGELPSEGVVEGAIQVPPDGQPICFMADHPVTGGYPVAGVLTQESVARAAQLRPGEEVELQPDSGTRLN